MNKLCSLKNLQKLIYPGHRSLGTTNAKLQSVDEPKVDETPANVIEFEEFQLDLTYGQITGRWWGSKKKRPILMCHGWQDCEGSFATLIPLLPPEFSYLAIDWPGHGFSSHLPPGCYYHTVDFIVILEEIRIKMKWERISLIGHSMGAIVSFYYGAILPENVDLIVALDTLKPQNYPPHTTEKLYTFRATQLINLMGKLKEHAPEYTYDELGQRVLDGSYQSVDIDKAKYMFSHGIKPSKNNPNKFYFTRDVRVKYMQPFYIAQSVAAEYIKRIQAAYLFIKSDDRIFREPEKNILESIELFKRYNKNFDMLKIPGTHHVHLNQPELMAEKIGTFLHKHYIFEEQKCIELKCKL
ncbi:probable serine hydrolase isoform X1 [Contarinia nasturtii]|uniref:probable serine hydrolase isoform X1 n=1 Tax=Contarinia nasturtii TaxID=265458 RepID=UPI0012D47D9A|nr:probable serine hydrolase isoform X1 [Contarinia nasturtii]